MSEQVWAPDTFTIKTTKGEKVKNGETLPDCPFGIDERPPSGWYVTHIPSGLFVRSFLTREQARKVAERLSAIDIDWDAVAGDPQWWPTLSRAQMDAIRAAVA